MATTMVQKVSPEVERALPAVLVNYLWGLVVREGRPENQAFILQRQTLGGRELQDIWHICNPAYEEHHRAFGFDAVNATVMVTRRGGALHMGLAGPLEALGFVAS